ncbi:hypothetical protein B0J17DRAFT_654623 [Rhizoctonia solani]|nr:hypothetical protein B0J17DRAFT_654623 [Rhizoctonia solani]
MSKAEHRVWLLPAWCLRRFQQMTGMPITSIHTYTPFHRSTPGMSGTSIQVTSNSSPSGGQQSNAVSSMASNSSIRRQVLSLYPGPSPLWISITTMVLSPVRILVRM